VKTDVEELSPTRVKLTIEVPFEELDHAFDVTYKSLAKKVQIKGFRPGKAPAPLIDRFVGRGVVVNEAVNHAVPELYNQAVRDEEVYALGQPEVEITKLDDGTELAFTAEVDVRPKFEVTGHEGIEVTVDDAGVTEERVDEQLDNLRERFSSLAGVERPVESGDHVSIDLAAAVDGEPLEDVQVSGYSYEVGTNSMLEGLDDTLVGMSAEEEATFATTLVGGEHEGKAADVTVTVHSVKVKERPELDDEFAQMASEFDTVEELRADVRSRVERMRRLQQLSQARDRALEKLIDSIEVPLPEAVVKDEADRRRQGLEEQLQQSGISKEDYLAAQEQSEEEHEEELESAARSAVKAGFVLDQLARQEELGADNQDLTRYVTEQAQRMGVRPEQLARHLQESNQLGVAYTEVVRAKALDLIMAKAVVSDESGNTIVTEEAEAAEEKAKAAAEAAQEAQDSAEADADQGEADGESGEEAEQDAKA
jgi:trigger factor